VRSLALNGTDVQIGAPAGEEDGGDMSLTSSARIMITGCGSKLISPGQLTFGVLTLMTDGLAAQ
jgi:hypothetical protein